MNNEKELKFLPKVPVTIQEFRKLLKSKDKSLKSFGRVKEVHQEDTYFDDEGFSLRDKGESFRVRKKTDKFVVTYKKRKTAQNNESYVDRNEFEVEVPSADGQKISANKALELLQEKYPKLVLPQNLREVLTVINDRKKINIFYKDGTNIEMAFDSLKAKDVNGALYFVNPEIEFEVKSGESSHLNTINDSICERYSHSMMQQNHDSKYSRSKKEMEEKQLTVREVTACAIMSEVLKSEEFSQLKYKGQILSRYNKPTEQNLDRFKDFNYLTKKIEELKRGDYKIPITQEIYDKISKSPELKRQLGNNYQIVDNISLEDMFSIMLSDTHYKIAEAELEDFLNKNYFSEGKAATNRLSHSQQVMLIAGLACKSEQVGATFEEKIMTMMSALFHDIGHVLLSHVMERQIEEETGNFGHEANGARVFQEICYTNRDNIKRKIYTFFRKSSQDNVKNTIQEVEKEIKQSIEDHSTKRSAKRRKGIVAQGPRFADKVAYAISDVRDIIELMKERGIEKEEDLLSDDWIDDALNRICEDQQFLLTPTKKKILSTIINPIRKGNYGKAVIGIVDTIRNYPNEASGNLEYNLDSNLWKFMKEIMNRTMKTYKEINDESNHKHVAKAIFLRQLKGPRIVDKEGAISEITKNGELQLQPLTCCLKWEQIQGKEPITDEDYHNMQQELETYLVNELIYRGEDSEEVRTGMKKFWEEKNFSKEGLLKAYLNMDTLPDYKNSWTSRLRETIDNQLKIEPTDEVGLEEIANTLGGKLISTDTEKFEDEYYSIARPKNETKKAGQQPRGKIKYRKTLEKNGEQGPWKTIIVNLYPERQKKIEVERKKYCEKVENNTPVEEAWEQLRGKYNDVEELKELVIIGTSGKSALINRTTYHYELENGIIFTINYDIDDRGFKQIEIKTDFPSVRNMIKKKLTEKYTGKIKFTKETKDNRATRED